MFNAIISGYINLIFGFFNFIFLFLEGFLAESNFPRPAFVQRRSATGCAGLDG
jgi:hypothetical protein